MGSIFRRSSQQQMLSQLADASTNVEFMVKKHINLWLSAVIDGQCGLNLKLSNYQAALDEIEASFSENIQPFMDRVISNEDAFVTVSNMLELNINFLGNAQSCGAVKQEAILNILGLELPDIDLSSCPSLLVSLNILLHVLLKFLNKIHNYDDAFELLSDNDSSAQSNKENDMSGGSDSSFSTSHSLKRLGADELRILKTAASKRNSDLRCYVLSKNLLAAAASSLRVEWSCNEKVGFVRRRIRDAVELLDYVRNEVNISLGPHMTANQKHSAYSLLVHLLGLIRIRFLHQFEDILSFLSCQEAERGMFCDQIAMSVRHLEDILSRGYLRFVQFDQTNSTSRITALQIADSEDVRYIINVLLSVLNCVNGVAKNDIPPKRLSTLLKESYIEVVKSKLMPDWKSMEKYFTDALSVTYEEIMAELPARK